ncbi:MAG: ComEC/Rec2 family competence protein [Alphaproteobacteria bacterium]|nr:ComEC/Rec2 family competence protein [Alphaproteobacteria bacterium]
MPPLRAFSSFFTRERTRWPYWLPVALAAGIVAYFTLSFEPPLWVLLITPVLTLAAWLLRNLSWPATIILFVLSIAALGFSAAQLETLLDARPMLGGDTGAVPISGRVAMTDIMPDGLRLTLTHPHIGNLPASATPERVRLKFNELTLDDAPPTGAQVSLYGQLEGPSEPVAPFAANFRRQAYFKHLGGIGWSYGKITVDDPAPMVASWSEKLSLTLECARKTLARHVYERLSGDVAAMTAARLNGEQTAISPAAINAMRGAGLAHLLSTSGFHVTIMALLIYFPLRMLLALSPWLALRYPIKKWAAMAAIFSALGYTFLVGSQAATLRSMFMTGLAMLAIASDRRATPLRLVMLSAAICMLFAPDAVMGPSFQMSFAAVFCLIAAYPEILSGDRIGMTDYLPKGLRSFAAHTGGVARASAIATAATTPFALYHFQTFNLYGLIANMLAIPITSFWVMPSILAAYLTAPFGCDAFFIDVAGVGVALTLRVAKTVAAWPHAIVYFPAMPGIALIAIVLGGLWLCLWREHWRYAGLVPILIGMLYPLYTPSPDFYVAPDGKVWAARLDDGRLAVSNAKREKFAVQQWQQLSGNTEIIDAAGLPPDNPQIHCDDEGCAYRRGKHLLAMPLLDAAALEDCDHADIVIAPVMIKDCAAKQVIDAQALAEHGAYAIYFDGTKARIDFTRDERGARPWSVGWESGEWKREAELIHSDPK